MNPSQEASVQVGALRSLAQWCHRERVSVVLASLVAAFLLVTPTAIGASYSSGMDSPPPLTDRDIQAVYSVVAGVCVVAGVLIARRSTLLATALTLLPFVIVPWWGSFAWGWLLGTIAVAMGAVTVSWYRALVPYVAALVVVALYCSGSTPAMLPIGLVTSGSDPEYRPTTFVLYLVAITAVVAVSASISASRRAWHRHRAATTQEAHARHVERVVGERAQVARDLHDVVAHHVSLVAVRAESAPYQHPGLGEDARTVLAEIADDARQALGELRQVLVVLQRAEGSHDGQPHRAPQPEAGDVDELVVSARAAGQRVEVDGRWAAVPPAQGYVLYRAVQEGLTNARRHAPQSVVTLTRTRAGSTVGFTLTNSTRKSEAGEPGRGLVGMRERVESLGGTMDASVVGDRFSLVVTVPVDVDVDVEADDQSVAVRA